MQFAHLARHPRIAALGILLALVLAGCAGTSTTGGTATATVNTSGGGGGPAPLLVKVGTATVSGKSEQILTNAQGMTLYYFDPDTATTVACTGSCTGIWPPLLLPSGATLAPPSGLSGTLSILNGANGKQITYNGHPLYTYSGDTAAGQTNGNGIEGKWHVATPSIPTNTGSGSGY